MLHAKHIVYKLINLDIGVLAALLQARHVRPSLARLGEIQIACYGCFATVFAFACLTILPMCRESQALSTGVLYAAATGLAYTSATVVTALTAAAAALCDEEGGDERLRRGRALGVVRSKVCRDREHGGLLTSPRGNWVEPSARSSLRPSTGSKVRPCATPSWRSLWRSCRP